MISYKYILSLFLVFISTIPTTLSSEETGNLVSQTYFNGSQFANGWTGTNDHNHGNQILAGVHGEYLENTVTLGDTLTKSQMNGGWTSKFSSDIWHWNDFNSTTIMTQTITGSDGSSVNQVKEISINGCGGWNCGGYNNYTNTYIQGLNSQDNFDIKVRYDFSDTSLSSLHRSPDIKNPTLIVEHSLLTVSQQSDLAQINDDINYILEQQAGVIDISSLNDEVLDIQTDDLLVGLNDLVETDDIYFDDIVTDEIILDVVLEAGIGTDILIINDAPIVDTLVDQPGEVLYEEEFTEIAEEFGIEEEVVLETNEVSNDIQTESGVEDGGVASTDEAEPVEEYGEEISADSETEVAEETGQTESIESARSNQSETESASESEAETENIDVSSDGETTADSNQPTETSTDLKLSEQIKNISDKIQNLNITVDKKLALTSVIIAKAISKNNSIDSYSEINKNIYNNMRIMDGGLYEQGRAYFDDRELYPENKRISLLFDNKASQYQRELEEANNKVFEAEQELKIIRGY